jgi:trehalose 6-phosphate synthase
VASLIQPALKEDAESTWWHLHDHYLQCAALDSARLKRKAHISEGIVEGHYRYCNEFLWPLMHGRDDLCHYSEADRDNYKALNMAVAACLNLSVDRHGAFVHDYQLGLVSEYLAQRQSSISSFFWHIPWPATLPIGAESHVAEIANGLLRFRKIGFHLQAYAENFRAFVQQHLPEYTVSCDGSIISRSGRQIDVIANPAGVDSGFWYGAARAGERISPLNVPYILSVDRADYTKGIVERIEAIRILFRDNPALKGKLQFVFVCQQTRSGLAAFDQYWERCQSLYRECINEFGSDEWTPIVWLPAMKPEELAKWYACADLMLVNPLVDGLNLTAKEFVASTMLSDSALVLSQGAGVWQELGDNSTTISRCTPADIAEAIKKALAEPSLQRRTKMNALKRTVRQNSLDKWWQLMVERKSAGVDECFQVEMYA